LSPSSTRLETASLVEAALGLLLHHPWAGQKVDPGNVEAGTSGGLISSKVETSSAAILENSPILSVRNEMAFLVFPRERSSLSGENTSRVFRHV